MALTIERTTEEFFPKTIKAVMFGRPGAGKTALVPQYPNPLIVASETNFMSIAGKDIPVIRCNDLMTYKEIIAYSILPADQRAEKFGFPVDTLIIDTIDELQVSLMMEKFKSLKLEFDGWAWILQVMSDSVKRLKQVPDLNVIFNCHIQSSTVPDSDGGEVASHQPMLYGKFKDIFPGLVDLAFMIEPKVRKVVTTKGVEEVTQKWFVCKPNAAYPFLKDGSPGTLPSRIEMDFETDYDRIHALVYEVVEGAKEAEEAKIAAASNAAAAYAQPDPPTEVAPEGKAESEDEVEAETETEGVEVDPEPEQASEPEAA